LLAPPLRLEALLPGALDAPSPLSASGPGFAVVSGWLSAAELDALRAYAGEIPAFPRTEAFHTYERTEGGGVVPSRTEHFAHLCDTHGCGAFLRDGRLKDICARLREGRPFSLYKEKLNYKLKGGGGGYLPHVDFYHNIDPVELKRLGLMEDKDICVCMIAIDDMDMDNGCPEVAPGWHTRGAMFFRGATDLLTQDDKFQLEETPLVDPNSAPWTPVRLRAGDVLIYGNLLPHKSGPNLSARNRRALFAVYSDARFGELRVPYYALEAVGRRAKESSKESGRANGFFTGQPVHAPADVTMAIQAAQG
jgi:hypothetical protein